MTEKDFDPLIWKMWSIHEAFRKVGFLSDNIWVELDRTRSVFITLKTQDKKFAAFVDKHKMSKEKLHERWTAFATALKDGSFTQEELQRVWEASEVCARKIDLITSLIDAGFRLPLGSD